MPLHATFTQHDQRTEYRIVLDHDPQLLRPCAVGHALHQQTMDARLRPGFYEAVIADPDGNRIELVGE
jgi:hypothetical protein